MRLSAQLDFALEPETLAAVREMAPQVAHVSAERIRDEVIRLLRHGRGRGLRLLRDTGLLAVVLPEIDAMRGVPQPPAFHPEGDVFVHTCLVLDGLVLPRPGAGAPGSDEEVDLLFGALLHDVGKPPTKTVDEDGRVRFNGHDALGESMSRDILERFKMPRRTIDSVAGLVGTHMKFPNLPSMRPARLRRFLGDPGIGLHLALHEADCGASHGS